MGFFQNRDYNLVNEYFNAHYYYKKKSEFNLTFYLKSWFKFQKSINIAIYKNEKIK